MNKFITFVKSNVKLEYIILTLLMLVGFVVRLYKVDNPVADWHSWRQADTAAVSRNYVLSGIDLINPTFDDISSIQSGIDNPTGIRMVELPIYNAVHAMLYNSFPQLGLEVWGRILTSIIAIITSFVLYLLVKKNIGPKTALLSVFFYLFLPFNIYFTRVILPDPLGVLFALLGLYLYPINVMYSSVFYALAFLQKPYLGVFLLPLLPEFLKKENLRKNILFAVLSFTPFLIWRYRTSLNPEGIPFYEWAFNGDRIRFHPSWFRWLFGERLGILILGVWGLVPYALGLIKKQKNNLNLYLNLSMLVYLVVVATANVRHDYYQIMIIPAVSVSLAIGALWMYKKSKLLLMITLITMFLISWDRVKPFYQVNHPELIDVGNVVDQTLPKDAKIVAPYNGDTAFLYQTKRKGWPAVDDSIEGLIERGATHYVSVDLGSLDTVNFSKKYQTITKTDKYIILDLQKPTKK